MRIACRFAVLAAVCLVATNVNAAPFGGLATSASVPDTVVVTYDPADGSLMVNGNGNTLTTLELKSAGGNFTPDSAAGVFSPPFDVISADKLFKLDTAGFESLDFGMAVAAGLSSDAVLADMDINGSILPNGGLDSAPGGAPMLYVVPEPSSLVLIFAGIVGLLGLRRK